MPVHKSVFISYRRKDAAWALAMFQDLNAHEFDVFFDIDGIAAGEFEPIIEANIKSRAHFLVLLTPTALDRCGEPGDWLLREIRTALQARRNIVPVFLDGFRAPQDLSDPVIGRLLRFNALSVPLEFFPEAMTRLRKKYLSMSVDVHIDEASFRARAVAEQAQTLALRQAAVVHDVRPWWRRRIAVMLSTGFAAASLSGTYAVYSVYMEKMSGPFASAPSTTAQPPNHVAYSLAADAFFSFNSYNLSPEGRAKLDDFVAKALMPTVKIEKVSIVAYEAADENYSEAQLVHLTQRRADAVKQYLTYKGIPASLITASGKGTVVAQADSATREGRAKNRVAEIELYGWQIR